MRKNLRHCGQKIATQAIYQVDNYGDYSYFFIFRGTDCPHCHKPVIGYAGYDIWGQPVYFRPDGSSTIPMQTLPAFQTGLTTNDLLSQTGMASKKNIQRYLALISSGEARPVSRVRGGNVETRGAIIGISEYSRRAAGRQSREYVLRQGLTASKKSV